MPVESVPGTAAGPARAQRKALALIAVGLMLTMTTWFSTAAVLGELRERWSLSTNESSVLIVVLQLGFVVGGLGSAMIGLADRMPLRRLIAVSAMLAGAANALIVVADQYWAAVVLRLATGAFLAGVYPPALKLIATWFREGRGAAMGVMVAALTVGSAGPHLLNGVGGARWTDVMYGTSLLTVAGALVIGRLGFDGPHPFPPTRFEIGQAARAMAQREVRLASLAYLGHMWELYAMWAWIAVFLSEAVERANSGIDPSLLAFAVISAGAAGSVVAGVAGDHVGKARSATAAMVTSGAAALVVGWSALPFAAVVAVSAVWGFAVVADSAQFSAIVSERADQEYVGTALTVQLALGFSLTIATMWLVPIVRDGVGWWAAFAMLAPGAWTGAWALRRLEVEPGSR